jgi:hypothetical protein
MLIDNFRRILKTLHRVRPAVQFYLYAVVCGILVYVAIMVSPAFKSADDLLAETTPMGELSKFKGQMQEFGEVGSVDQTVVHVNNFIELLYRVEKVGSSQVRSTASKIYKYEFLITCVGAILFIVLAAFHLRKGSFGPLLADPDPGRSIFEVVDLVTRFEEDVQIAYRESDEILRRATIILMAGIILAFVGIGVFIAMIPSYQGLREGAATLAPHSGGTGPQVQNPSEFGVWGFFDSFLSHYAKSLAIIIFIEATAWFLLKQYRDLFDDYKYMFRVYLKRANYALALRVLNVAIDKTPREQLGLVAALLGEDLTGRLQQGQTTEELEREKIPDANPVFSLFGEIIKSVTGKG